MGGEIVPAGKEGFPLVSSILFISDDGDKPLAAVNLLEENGFNVAPVHRRDFAVKQATDDPNIVLVILAMLASPGTEICREIRREKPAFALPILILAPQEAQTEIVGVFEAGANDYLVAPYTQEELLARIRALVNLKESVSKALALVASSIRARINPHFLFSSLSSIIPLIAINPPEARSLCYALSDYLRNALNFARANELAPLDQEIDLVKAYAALEKVRMAPRLDFQFELDAIPKVTIPGSVLLPLVENAIQHGIFHKPEGGQVKLKVKRKADSLHISVVDNGMGMRKGQLDSLLAEPGRSGISSINQRLHKYYGSGLALQSTPGQGTIVSFVVPLPNQKDEEESADDKSDYCR